MSTANVQAFVESLKDRSFRRKLLSSFALIPEGDWQGITRIAAEEGFNFTEEELKAVIPKGFFRGSGKNSNLGWNLSTLPHQHQLRRPV